MYLHILPLQNLNKTKHTNFLFFFIWFYAKKENFICYLCIRLYAAERERRRRDEGDTSFDTAHAPSILAWKSGSINFRYMYTNFRTAHTQYHALWTRIQPTATRKCRTVWYIIMGVCNAACSKHCQARVTLPYFPSTRAASFLVL